MDLEEYWQENRTFVTRVGLGALAFLVGLGIVSRTVGSELRGARAQLTRDKRELQTLVRDGFEAGSLEAAEEDHDALRSAARELAERVRFEPRSEFRAAAEAASPASYLGQVTRVRERLFPAAVRNNVSIEDSLGLPEQSPTRAEEIERTLEGLDALEQLLTLAIEEGVDEIDKLQIRVDPDLFGRRGVGTLETTRVEFRMTGPNGALLRTLARTQGPGGRRLHFEKLAISSTRERPDEVRATGTIAVSRVAADLVRTGEPEEES